MQVYIAVVEHVYVHMQCMCIQNNEQQPSSSAGGAFTVDRVCLAVGEA